MQIINSSLVRDVWTALKPQLDAFGELARTCRTELHNSTEGIHIYRKSNLKKPLGLVSQQLFNLRSVPAAKTTLESIVLSFDISQCLLIQDILPETTSSKLFELLQLANVRDIPLAAKDYIWGYQVAIQQGPNIRVQRVILARDRFAPLLQSLKAEGLSCDAIVFRSGSSSCLPIALTPAGVQFGHASFRNWVRMAGFGFATLLLSASTFIGVLNWKQSQAMASANAAESRLSQDVAKFTSKFQASTNETQALNELIGRKHNIASQAEIMEELARVLPDSAFIVSYSGENGKVSIEGAASDPEALISLLDSSPLFSDVRFLAPSLRNPSESQAHFSIQMNVADGNEE